MRITAGIKRVLVRPQGIGGAAHQQGFSEHSLRKPLARANAQPAFATFPRQPSRVRSLGTQNYLSPARGRASHFVLVIPVGITHNFVLLTNKKSPKAFFTVRTPRCTPAGDRTLDPRIKSPLLYQLSYRRLPQRHVLFYKGSRHFPTWILVAYLTKEPVK